MIEFFNSWAPGKAQRTNCSCPKQRRHQAPVGAFIQKPSLDFRHRLFSSRWIICGFFSALLVGEKKQKALPMWKPNPRALWEMRFF